MEWILIVFMVIPGNHHCDGDHVKSSRTVTQFQTKKECQVALKKAIQNKEPAGMRDEGVCVTKDHFNGNKYMDGIALD